MANKKVVGKGVFFCVMSALQIIFEMFALFNPGWVMAENKTLKFVEEFENTVDSDAIATAPVKGNIYVDVAIGLFKTVVQGKTIPENREGLKGVIGFIMVSLLAAAFSLIHSLLVVKTECCENKCVKCFCGEEKCKTCLKAAVEKLRTIANSNYAAGVSAGAASAMFAYTTSDLADVSFGSSFILEAISSGFSILTLILNICMPPIEHPNTEPASGGNHGGAYVQMNEPRFNADNV
uniref:Uncharacterized LOC100181182 n=2 Tax=Ciona intestinalis TaxID=7719 RepID=F6VGK9_CIOIN